MSLVSASRLRKNLCRRFFLATASASYRPAQSLRSKVCSNSEALFPARFSAVERAGRGCWAPPRPGRAARPALRKGTRPLDPFLPAVLLGRNLRLFPKQRPCPVGSMPGKVVNSVLTTAENATQELSAAAVGVWTQSSSGILISISRPSSADLQMPSMIA